MKIWVAQLNQVIGDFSGNLERIQRALFEARAQEAQVVVFPELALCGYFPEDLLLDPGFITHMEELLPKISPWTSGMFVTLGLARKNPDLNGKPLYNSAAVWIDGVFQGFQDKRLLPTYDVFDERRYFAVGQEQIVWEHEGTKIAVTLCEDLWQHAGLPLGEGYPYDPVEDLQQMRPDLVLNLSASPYHFTSHLVRQRTFAAVARTLGCPIVVCNQVGANDALVFDGKSFALSAKGECLAQLKGFEEQGCLIDLEISVCEEPLQDQGLCDLYQALVLGVRDYFTKQGFQKGILGLSGGVDSALTACIAKEALGSDQLMAVALPTRFSSQESARDAKILADRLGIAFQELSIDGLFENYLDWFRPLFSALPRGVTEENLQSRIRGTCLMAFCNKWGFLLLNTGNKSELAMGYTTLYGDMAGALGVLSDVTKSKVYQLAYWLYEKEGKIPLSILTKPPSAELREGQKDEDTLPPYAVLDGILEDYLEEGLTEGEICKRHELSLEFVQKVLCALHQAEYKRRQAPLGIRVTKKAFVCGRRVPIVQKWRI